MSGTIFMSAETSEDKEASAWNPLQCNLCKEQYQDPCILHCYHSFCSHCIEPRIEEGKTECPLCGCETVIAEGSALPTPDLLLKFLVESSSGDKVQCANCDKTEAQMYFCSTCSQSLCGTCREETHRAKMFMKHDIVLHTKHTRDIQRECKIHGEPYILFSTEKKVMLCINCFRDMKIESRSHCVDLETAYKQGFQKLDDAMQSIRDLQTSVRDGILLLHALLEEIEVNVEKEKQAIGELYSTMLEKITEMKESMMAEIDRQYDEKEKLFKNQLVSLTTFLPTLRTHLVTCAAFSSSANKYEFLDFTYVLMKRLTAIIQVQHPLHPSQTSEIFTDYKSKFAKCLEPLLFPHRNGASNVTPSSIVASVASTRYEPSPCINTVSMSNLGSNVSSHSNTASPRFGHHNTKKFKLKLLETKGFFSDHCKEFDDAHRELMLTVEGLKQRVQELQRDITIRRSLAKDSSFSDLMKMVCEAEERLANHQVFVEDKQTGLEKHWEESLDKIVGEQEVYIAQLQDVGRLKSEVESVKTIAQRLSSFMSSIASVTQRLAPKLGMANTVADQEDQHTAMLKEITTMQPDSQQRVDAIRTAQEERDIKTANRTNPLDKELIKTKGLLRAPSARKDSSKRSSMEIKEFSESDAEAGKSDEAIAKNMDDKETANMMSLLRERLHSEIISTGGVLSNAGTNNNEVNSPKKTVLEGGGTENVKGVSDIGSYNSDEKVTVPNDSSQDVMPDIAINVENKETDSNSEHSTDYNSDITTIASPDASSNSESDFNSSMDSQTSEEGVKPGLVKDLIAKVDGIGKGSQRVDLETSKLNGKLENGLETVIDSVGTSRPVKVKENAPGDKAVSPKQKINRDLSSLGNADMVANGVEAEGVTQVSPVESVGGVSVSSDDTSIEVLENGVEKSSPSEDGEDIYVTKTLPELAQVFEPGELKPKKRRGKTDKGKGQKDK